jgi:hypothetical protein
MRDVTTILRRVISASALAVAGALAVAMPLAHAQSTTAVGEAAPGLNGIGLTPPQKRIIYERTASDRQQPVPQERASVGETVPDSVILNEMPIEVKDEVGVLRDFKFAVTPDAQAILIVDPTSRRIVDIVTRADAGR